MPLFSFAVPLVHGRHARLFWCMAMFAGLLFSSVMALTPVPPVHLDTGWDKANHALTFIVLTLSGRFAWPSGRAAWVGLIAGLLAFGGLIELLQLHIPGRDAEWADWGADALGITLGAVFAQLIGRWVPRQ